MTRNLTEIPERFGAGVITLSNSGQDLIEVAQEIEKENNQSLLAIRRSEPTLQRRALVRIKTELTNKVDCLSMPEERKSYLIHQLNNAHDIDAVVDLLREINRLQRAQELQLDNPELDLLFLSITPRGIEVLKHTFSQFAGAHLEESDACCVSPALPLAAYLLSGEEFEIQDQQIFKDSQDRELAVIFLAVNLKHQAVRNIQRALDYAQRSGARTVGLSQQVAEISKKGLLLDPRGMSLTTGEAFSTLLKIHPPLLSVQKNGVKLSEATVGFIGVTENSLAVAASIVAEQVSRVVLMHHSPIEVSAKLQQLVMRILKELLLSEASSPVVTAVKSHWRPGTSLSEFLALPAIKEVMVVSSDLALAPVADLLFTGSSSLSGFLRQDLLKERVVLVKMDAPPEGSPFGEPGLAETISLAMGEQKNFLHIGEVDRSAVLAVLAAAQRAGFLP